MANQENEIERVKCLIIGSGPAGYTAAIYAARANLNPVMYVGPEPGGQLTTTTEVENFPGYPQGIDGPAMMEEFKAQAERFDTDVRFGVATKTDLSGDIKTVEIDNGKKTIEAHTVIISTGASAKWLGLESEQRLREKGGGVSACAVCDGFFYKGLEVAIVGAGDSACEEGSYLAKLCKKVHMIVRRDKMRASKIMQERVKGMDNIEIHWNTETEEVLGDDEVTGIRVVNNQTGEKKEIPVQGFFVAIGHKPNTDIFKGQIDMDDVGYITPVLGTAQTSLPGVFVGGDAADKHYRQAVTAAGTGCMAALDAERYLAERGLA